MAMHRKKGISRSVDYEEWLIKTLKDPEEAVGYLNAAIEDNDPRVFLLALRDVAEAHGGLLKLSRKTKLNRVNLYRMLSRKGNPEINSLSRLLDALGFRLAVETKSAKSKKRAA